MTSVFKESSVLLVNEEVLVFQPTLAVAVGVNEAIFVQQLHYWLKRSNNVRDGRRWVYNSLPEWNKQFPFWSESTLRRAISSLRKIGVVIVSEDYNRAAFDHTLWYSIDYDLLDGLAEKHGPPTDDSGGDEGRPDRSGQSDSIEGGKMAGPKASDGTDGDGQIDATNTRDYTKITTEITHAEKNYQVGLPTQGEASLPVIEPVAVVETVPETAPSKMPASSNLNPAPIHRGARRGAAAASDALLPAAAAEPEIAPEMASPGQQQPIAANDKPMGDDEFQEFAKALLYFCLKHQNVDQLGARYRTMLFREAKLLVEGGYTRADLKQWFQEDWMKLKCYREHKTRPNLFTVRQRIACIRDRDEMRLESYAVDLPEPVPSVESDGALQSGDVAWDLMVAHHFQGDLQEAVRGIRVVDVYDLDSARVYEVCAGTQRDWMESRMSRAIRRELRMILRNEVKSVNLVFVTEEVRLEGEGTALIAAGDVGRVLFMDGNNLGDEGASVDADNIYAAPPVAA